MAQKKGLHRFCFTNKSPYQETIDFDVHVGHFTYYDQHAKDGKLPSSASSTHFPPLPDELNGILKVLSTFCRAFQPAAGTDCKVGGSSLQHPV